MEDFGTVKCGETIKRIRLKHKLTQAQFAEIIGKSPSTLHAYENNIVVPPFEVIKTISELFHIAIGTIMGLDDLKARKESMSLIRGILNLGESESFKSNKLPMEDLRKLYEIFTGMNSEDDDE